MTGPPDQLRSDEGVVAGVGADIEDGHPRLDRGSEQAHLRKLVAPEPATGGRRTDDPSSPAKRALKNPDDRPLRDQLERGTEGPAESRADRDRREVKGHPDRA